MPMETTESLHATSTGEKLEALDTLENYSEVKWENYIFGIFGKGIKHVKPMFEVVQLYKWQDQKLKSNWINLMK